MNNIITKQITTIDDLKGLIHLNYGSLLSFWNQNNEFLGFSYPTFIAIVNGYSSRHKHIKKICKLLNINMELIEEWKDI
jgi:hypothetical protein